MNVMNTLFPEVIRLTKSKNHGSKRCSKCGKTIALKYFSKNRYSKDGYRHTCKECDKRQQHECRQRIQYIRVEYKQCSECGRVKPIEKFGIDKTKKDGHRSYCLKCMSDQRKFRRRLQLIKQPRSKL